MNELKHEVREIIDHCKDRQTADFFIVIEDASTFTSVAQDALLKLLEEPRPFYHFVIFTTDLGPLLATVRSRATIFVQKHQNPLKNPPAVAENIKDYAKKLLSATDRDIIPLAEELTNPKTFKKPRETILQIVETAIELAYKSYFITKNPAFIHKIPRFLALSDALKGNGNIKLQLIAKII